MAQNSLAAPVPEQPQVNSIGQCFVTSVVRMPVVSTVSGSDNFTRGIRITEHAIKVDHIVIFAADSDPRIDRLALILLRGRKNRKGSSRLEKPFDRGQSAAENLQSFRMSTLDELLMTLD